MPTRRTASGSPNGSGCPSSRASPASGTTAPPRILMSVDFPAPFSPSSAWTSPGRLQNGQRAEGRVVVDPEDSLQIAVRLEHVLHDRHRLRALAVGRGPADDGDPRRLLHLLVESLEPVLDRGHGRMVDDEDLALALEIARPGLGGQAASLHIV